MKKVVVGIFEEYEAAESVARELVAAGVSRHDVRLHSLEHPGGEFAAGDSDVYGILKSLGVPFDRRDAYAEAVRRGKTLVTVETDDAHLQRAIAIMEEHGGMDLDDLIAQWRREGWKGYEHGTAPPTSAEVTREHEAKGTPGGPESEPEHVRALLQSLEKPYEIKVYLRDERTPAIASGERSTITGAAWDSTRSEEPPAEGSR